MAIEFHNNLSLNGNQVTGLGTPTQNTDAATKQYVDGVAQGLDIKASVKAASTGNLTLSGTQTVDGIALSAGDRVLVKNQSDASENGIYVVSGSAWTRSADAAGSNLTLGSFTFVESGSVNKGRGYVYSDANAWTQFSESTSITAGTGITVNGQQISIDTTWAGQTAITTLGTISTGIWNGSTIGVAYGGTGATTLTGYVKGSGTSALTASATIPVTDISGRALNGTITVATGTNSYSIDTSTLDATLRANAVVQLRNASNQIVFADVTVGASAVSVATINNGASSFDLKYTITV